MGDGGVEREHRISLWRGNGSWSGCVGVERPYGKEGCSLGETLVVDGGRVSGLYLARLARRSKRESLDTRGLHHCVVCLGVILGL